MDGRAEGLTRQASLAAVGLIYATGAAWIVGAQGEAYRRNHPAAGIAGADDRGVHVVAAAGESRPDRTAGPPGAASTIDEPAGRERKISRPSDRVEVPAPPAPVTTPERAVLAARADPTSRPPAPDFTGGEGLSLKPRPLVIAGLTDLPAADEARFGRLLHELILTNHASDEDSPYQRQVLEATRPMIDLRSRPDGEVTITVLDANDVNAFSHMGGYIYLTRGLFSLAATEAEYRFVVGHELAHLELKHAQILVARKANEGGGGGGGVGTIQALYHQIAEGYTEAQEYEADARALDRMLKLDHTKRECLAFLRKLVGLSEQAGFRNGRRPPRSDPAAAVQDVANHLPSAPAAWSRLNRLEARFNTAPGGPAARGRPASSR